MSLNVSPVRLATAASSIVSTQKAPVIFGESIPRPKLPVKQLTISIMDKLVESIRKKPDSERKLFDYAILFADQLMKLYPKMRAS